MQKRSHKLLASTLLANVQGFQSRRYELAFLLGSFQPDCNPLTYLKGSIRARLLGGHNFTNSRPYVLTRLQRLEQKDRWNLWNYYTLSGGASAGVCLPGLFCGAAGSDPGTGSSAPAVSGEPEF